MFLRLALDHWIPPKRLLVWQIRLLTAGHSRHKFVCWLLKQLCQHLNENEIDHPISLKNSLFLAYEFFQTAGHKAQWHIVQPENDWILIDFGSGNTKTVNNYGVAQRRSDGSQSGSDDYRITAWKLQGSNDNSTFTDLHSLIEEGNDFLRKDVTLLTTSLNTQPNYLDNFIITDLSGNTTAYRYYRLWIDNATGYAIVGEMFMEGY